MQRFWIFDCIALLDEDTWIMPKKEEAKTDVNRFLSVCCAYEDIIASRYSDDESDQSDIADIDST
jgi:hypothetical protein